MLLINGRRRINQALDSSNKGGNYRRYSGYNGAFRPTATKSRNDANEFRAVGDCFRMESSNSNKPIRYIALIPLYSYHFTTTIVQCSCTNLQFVHILDCSQCTPRDLHAPLVSSPRIQ